MVQPITFYNWFQIVRVMQHIFDKEVYGYGEKREAKRKFAVKKVRGFLGRSLCLQMSFALVFATFGLPKRDSEHLWPYLSLFPLIALVQQTGTYFHPEVPIQATTRNVTEVQKEDVKESLVVHPSVCPKSALSMKKRHLLSINYKEKKVEAKGDISQPPAKNSGKETTVGKAPRQLSAMLKIMSLPWDFIVSTMATIGTAFALTFAYWFVDFVFHHI